MTNYLVRVTELFSNPLNAPMLTAVDSLGDIRGGVCAVDSLGDIRGGVCAPSLPEAFTKPLIDSPGGFLQMLYAVWL